MSFQAFTHMNMIVVATLFNDVSSFVKGKNFWGKLGHLTREYHQRVVDFALHIFKKHGYVGRRTPQPRVAVTLSLLAMQIHGQLSSTDRFCHLQASGPRDNAGKHPATPRIHQ